MFPNEEEKKLFLILLSLTLVGKTIEKFIIMTGGGRNGKGVINEFNMKMLGNYGYTCANAVLLSPIKDGANQSIRNMNNKRGIVYREPDSGTYSKINSCTVKELTGGSEINARGLFASDTKTNLKGTHFLECNTKPDMSGDIDDAIIMRLIIIEFISTFTGNKDDVNETNNIYLGDDNLKESWWQEQHRCALFEILIDYWKMIKDDMNIEKFIPLNVKDRVKTYMSKSNKLMNWFNNNYEQVDDDKQVIVLRDVYQSYKDSEDFINLNKEERRKTTEKYVIEFFEKNPFTRKCFHLRDRRANIQETFKKSEVRNILRSFKIRTPEEAEDPENCNDNITYLFSS
jgi:phage/plasmid-associated DNA primase